MKRLIDYIERTLEYTEEASASGAERLKQNAFGATEMFIIFYPEYEQTVAFNWNHKWKPTFDKIIQEKYS